MRSLVTLLAAFLLLYAPAGLAAQEPTDGDAAPGSPLDHQGGSGDTHKCNAVAPTQVVCPTGPHTRGGNTLIHGFQGVAADYTGTLESNLTWVSPNGEVGSRWFRCDHTTGFASNCHGSGRFPPLGAAYAHTCFSYARGTTELGGSGHWGCYLTHN